MIKRVLTEDGECWAIVLHRSDTLEDLSNLQNGLVQVLMTATTSELFETDQSGFYHTLDLLQQSLLSIDQMVEYERYLKSSGQIKKGVPI